MGSAAKFKEAFEVESTHGAFYTGGNVEFHENILYCQTASAITLINIETGVVTKTIGSEDKSEDADTIQTFTVDKDHVVSSHKSGLLKLWNIEGDLLKIWKYIHKGPIARLNLKNNILASGGSDSCIRIWDLTLQTCTHNLKGAQGVINVVEMRHLDDDHNKTLIFGSGDDGKVYSWRLNKGGNLSTVYDAHFSKVTSLEFAHDGEHFITSGRDKVIILWKIGESKALRTIPIFKSIESITALPRKFKLPNFKADPDCIYIAAGGESGLITIWDITNSKEVYKQTNSLVNSAQEDGGLAIVKLICDKAAKQIAVISADHNIILHSMKSFVCLKQFIGFSDEILDIAYVGTNQDYLAVATNSCDIKLYDSSSMNCQLLKGHTDIVLALDTSKTDPTLMVSSAKDNSIRLWQLDDTNQMSCIATGLRHTNSVGSVAFSNLAANFIVSASQDNCIKLWQLSISINDVTLNCNKTQLAHDKDINCVAVSPNDKIIATASQDKSAKLFTDDLTLIGSLKGHKRGVWCVRFSPIDQVVLTSSADCTIKLWSVADLSCLKTFEGHDSSVLRANFISNGYQILSAGADGLVKLFTIKTSECVATFDSHEGRIWALAVKTDESGFVTGGSDSLLVKWRDVTEERILQRIKEEEDRIQEEQKLNNYLHNGQLIKALKYALKLERPLQVLKIVQGIIKKGDTTALADAVKELRDDQKDSLLKCSTIWNTNSRNCHSAQVVMNILLNEIQNGDFKPANLKAFLEAAMPYNERHFRRATKLFQDIHFITYTINCMRPHAKDL